ncbi:UNVERIFIED_CONTAM: hypothetical protein PYX00_003493 [Menopon gallinae]|uniref:Major facilitator superfamily (MFS) profile domain-containing protein n=1 Tax=Menopon gallinae TaxID=328185 RepID=A0AAW2I1Q1_9NEOP
MPKCTVDAVPARHVLCFMFFIGFTIVFLLRVNLNLAIVGMAVHNVTVSILSGNETSGVTRLNDTGEFSEVLSPGGEFEWGEFQQGLILGAFFYGYMSSQIPGGRIAEIYGMKPVFGTAVLLNGVLCLLIPLFARFHWVLLFIIRVVQGLGQGVLYPALSSCIMKWVPFNERARFIAITVQGCSLGPVVAMPLCGWILTTWGWPAVFYVSGVVTLIWYAAWLFLVYETPEVHPRISKKEKKYLKDNVEANYDEKPTSLPWKKVFASPQFWIGIFAHVGSDWGFHIFYTFGPKYMKDALGFDINKSALLSSLPFLCQYITATILGYVADKLVTDYSVPVRRIRKASVMMSHWGPAILLITMTFLTEDVTASVITLTVAVSMLGALTTGYYSNPIDIAPNFAGSLTGFANTLGSLGGIICTTTAGASLQKFGSPKGWHVIFYTAAALYTVTSMPFVLWIKSEVLPWNNCGKPKNVEMKLISSNDKSRT